MRVVEISLPHDQAEKVLSENVAANMTEDIYKICLSSISSQVFRDTLQPVFAQTSKSQGTHRKYIFHFISFYFFISFFFILNPKIYRYPGKMEGISRSRSHQLKRVSDSRGTGLQHSPLFCFYFLYSSFWFQIVGEVLLRHLSFPAPFLPQLNFPTSTNRVARKSFVFGFRSFCRSMQAAVAGALQRRSTIAKGAAAAPVQHALHAPAQILPSLLAPELQLITVSMRKGLRHCEKAYGWKRSSDPVKLLDQEKLKHRINV